MMMMIMPSNGQSIQPHSSLSFISLNELENNKYGWLYNREDGGGYDNTSTTK